MAAIGLVVVVAAGAVVLASGSNRGSEQVSSGPGRIGPPMTLTRLPLTEPEGWTSLATSPLSGRSQAQTTWTGDELLVWCGQGAGTDFGTGEPNRTDGAAYDPVADRWRPIAESPLPVDGSAFASESYATAWTGREWIIWGGEGPDAAAYEPETDTWRSIDAGPLGSRVGVASAWTGQELVIYGGADREVVVGDPGKFSSFDDGAAYDPTTDTWRAVPSSGAEGFRAKAVWAGDEVLIVGGTRGGGSDKKTLALDVEGGTWRELASSPFYDVTAPVVWTGRELVAVGRIGGGRGTDADPPVQGGVALFDPALDRWTIVADPPGPAPSTWILPTMMWSGQEVLLLGSPYARSFDGPERVGALAFEVKTRTWRTLPGSGLSARGGMSAGWTGSELLLWGGAAYGGTSDETRVDGDRYRPGPGR